MTGPRRREDDLAWTAFSWVPLPARHVVAAEGFTDFCRRRARLSAFLDSYGSLLTPDEVIARAAVLIDDQIRLMRQRASAGDATYQRMLEHGRAHALEISLGRTSRDLEGLARDPATDLLRHPALARRMLTQLSTAWPNCLLQLELRQGLTPPPPPV